MCSWTEGDSEFRWFMKGTMKELNSPFFPLISSFNWPFCISFFLPSKTCFGTRTNLWVFLSCCHCEPQGVDDRHQLSASGRDLTCLLFCGYALTPAVLVNQPTCTQWRYSVSGFNAVTFSCMLNAVMDWLCFCYSDKSWGLLAES